jgi:hypothetical protein
MALAWNGGSSSTTLMSLTLSVGVCAKADAGKSKHVNARMSERRMVLVLINLMSIC